MEAKYVALSPQAMRNLIPICELLKEFLAIIFEIQPSIAYHAHSKSFMKNAASEQGYCSLSCL